MKTTDRMMMIFDLGTNSKIRRLAGTFCIVVLFCGLLLPEMAPFARASEGPVPMQDYSRLLDFIQSDDLQDPLVEFMHGESGVDRAMNRENVAYLNQNQELMDRIRSGLNSSELKWQLSNATRRRMVVPEARSEYAALFENYCRDVVDYVLDRTHLPNPYQSIATLHDSPAREDWPAGGGIRAYLVHNVADEYVEEYVFFDASGEGKKIKIKLRNRVYAGEVGSYTSNLVIGEDHHYDFVRDPYTLWQNSAENPLNVFIAPIEETLHIALRSATESSIKSTLEEVRPENLHAIEQIIEKHMAIEEAVVGGIVNHLMPEIFDRFLPDPPSEHLLSVMAARSEFDKYRYLDRGIRVVDDLGFEAAIDLYRSDPGSFQSLLTEPKESTAATDSAPTEPALEVQPPVQQG
ncbi:MAG: hypothetical protein ACOWWM_12055 [Desulfobacterales bacterium]